MKHRWKQWLILLYTVLTVACVALTLGRLGYERPFILPFAFAWPEMIALAFIAGGEELTTPGVITACVMGAAMLLHVAAPVCGFFRIYWPFKALLCVKAVLNVVAFMLFGKWYVGLTLLLHGTLFILATFFYQREEPEAVPSVENGGPVPVENRPYPSQGMPMPGSGFPDR